MKQYQKSSKRNIFFALRRLRLSIVFCSSFSNLKNSANKKNKNNIYVIGHSYVQQRTNYHDHEGLYFPFLPLLLLLLSFQTLYTNARMCLNIHTTTQKNKIVSTDTSTYCSESCSGCLSTMLIHLHNTMSNVRMNEIFKCISVCM